MWLRREDCVEDEDVTRLYVNPSPSTSGIWGRTAPPTRGAGTATTATFPQPQVTSQPKYIRDTMGNHGRSLEQCQRTKGPWKLKIHPPDLLPALPVTSTLFLVGGRSLSSSGADRGRRCLILGVLYLRPGLLLSAPHSATILNLEIAPCRKADTHWDQSLVPRLQ